MFKIQFRKKKLQPNLQYSDPYRDQYPNHYTDEDPFYDHHQEPPDMEEFSTCIMCGDLITGSHITVTTKSGEHCLHPSCIVASFALIINGFSLLVDFIFRRREKQ